MEEKLKLLPLIVQTVLMQIKIPQLILYLYYEIYHTKEQLLKPDLKSCTMGWR